MTPADEELLAAATRFKRRDSEEPEAGGGAWYREDARAKAKALEAAISDAPAEDRTRLLREFEEFVKHTYYLRFACPRPLFLEDCVTASCPDGALYPSDAEDEALADGLDADDANGLVGLSAMAPRSPTDSGRRATRSRTTTEEPAKELTEANAKKAAEAKKREVRPPTHSHPRDTLTPA